jgi:Ohr subfamily peroxiredoxin
VQVSAHEEAQMARAIYTAKATVTGGRQLGHGVSDDGALDVQLRPPADGGGTNPEQLFAVGYAACFESALGAVGRRERLELGEVSIDSSVSLTPTENRAFKLGVELDVSVPGVDEDTAAKVVRAAELVCPYSNATRGNIDLKLIANGRALD